MASVHIHIQLIIVILLNPSNIVFNYLSYKNVLSHYIIICSDINYVKKC